ncbi:MAG: response regulator transcription factor [Bacteroidia bacterium]|jgi:DNA-binding LytR/AlgR family response regulator|nr:response regulator transcription factor [Bacteroidia bacterium]
MRILIVDDEPLLAFALSEMLLSMNYPNVFIETSFEPAKQHILQKAIDLVLLDINLGKGDEGILLAQECKQLEIPFIFVTSYSDKQTIDKALQTKPNAYLIKPISEGNLYTTMQLVQNAMQPVTKQTLQFKDGTEWIHLPIEKVLYLKSENVYVNVVTEHKTYLYRGSLQSLLQKVPVNSLVQTHRSYAINPLHIERVGASYLKIGQMEIPISRNFKHLVQHS